MKKLVFICGVCGVGKTTICNYIKTNNMLNNYSIFDIDDLESIHNYTVDTYNLFYENAIKKAVNNSGDKNIIMASCINPTDIEKIDVSMEIESIKMIVITCSNIAIAKRLKARDLSRNCNSDEFIKEQINYQNWILEHIELYKFHIDNTNQTLKDTALEIISYIY